MNSKDITAKLAATTVIGGIMMGLTYGGLNGG
jgi:hypothetical protein